MGNLFSSVSIKKAELDSLFNTLRWREWSDYDCKIGVWCGGDGEESEAVERKRGEKPRAELRFGDIKCGRGSVAEPSWLPRVAEIVLNNVLLIQ